MSQLWRLVLMGAFVVLSVLLPLIAYAATAVDGDFSLQVKVNGADLSEVETIVVYPDQELAIDLYISEVAREVTLQKLSAAVTFAGQAVATFSQDLGSFRIVAGDEYTESMTVDPREVLKLGDLTLATGIYPVRIELEYTLGDQPGVWRETKSIRIPGNPLSTPVGALAAMVSAVAAAAILSLMMALAGSGLTPGTTLPGSTPLRAARGLQDFAAERLEPAARGRVVGNIVKAARGLVVKERCPICGTRLRRGHCLTCRKPVKELRREYSERVQALALQGAELLASGEVAALDALCARLGIDARLGSDVVAVLTKARIVKVMGIARKVMGRAVVAGIGSGLSAVLWITVGGLAVLSATALVVILAASVAVPVTVAKGLQIKARRALRKRV